MFNPFRKSRRGRPANNGGWLKPATKQAITGIILIALAVITVFSFFDQAGRLGGVLESGLRNIFGWLAYPAPVLFVYIGYRLLRPNREPLPRLRVMGMLLAVVGLLGLFHLIGIPINDALQVAYEGRGGGFLGFMLSYPVSLLVSRLVAGIIFASALLVGIFITFDVSPAEVWQYIVSAVPSHPDEEETETEGDNVEEEEAVPATPRFSIRRMGQRNADPDPAQLTLDESEEPALAQQPKRKTRSSNIVRYKAPPLELLATSSRQPEGGDIDGNKKIIKETLENFNISVEMGKARIGPTVTQYTLRPDQGIRLSQITALQNDLARALKAHPVRIEAPVPNTDLVGIEIPNKEVALVRLRELLSSREYKKDASPLAFALGKDVAGKPTIAELDRMPHMLIAGATNSGKSVSIHTIITALLYRNSPQLLRLVLVDPKRVELAAYNGIPHLWGEPVIVDTSKALNALKWALREMDRRYKLLEESGARNIVSYNQKKPNEFLPYVVVVIDELADLMAKHAREVEGPIVRLSQLARAVGIHLILATQRPSVNVITGLIKANVPARVAFKVASQVDSRTILDTGGAEKLVGTGDMLFMPADNTGTKRLQGSFITEEEVHDVVKYIVEHNPLEKFVPEDQEPITTVEVSGGSSEHEGEGDDSLFEEAKRVALQSGKISASLLQRRLRIGYARAARILDMLEAAGVIGAAEGNKPREVIISADQPKEDNSARPAPPVATSPEGEETDEYDDDEDEEYDYDQYDEDDYEDEDGDEDDDEEPVDIRRQ